MNASVIDEEIAQVTARLASLKAHKNSIAPISRLPTELLVEIFLCLPDLPCKIIMNVCRHWHAVSSAAPALWTRIELDSWNRRHFRSQLRLSGDLPLTVSIRRLDSRRAASRVLEHAGRIASLSITGSDWYVFHFMHDMRHFAFPLLRALVLHPAVEDHDGRSIDVHVVMPPELLSGRMPSLREMEVYRIDCPWQSLRALQSLSLRPAVELPMHALLAVLADCPGMHTLDLYMAADRALPGHCHPVQLPLLKRLRIRDFAAVCVDLLAHLVFPLTTCLNLIPLGVAHGTHLRAIMDADTVRRHLNAQDVPAVRMVHIASPVLYDEPDYCFTITMLTAVDSRARFANVEEDARFAVTTNPPHSVACTEIMELVFPARATQSIVHLNIVQGAWVPTACMAALALLPALETVTLMLDKAGTRFCEAVLDSGRAHILRGINVCALVPTDAAKHTDSFIDMLARLLDSSRQSGGPLAHLKLKIEVVPVNEQDDVGELWEEEEYVAYEAKWVGIRSLVEDFVWERLESSLVQ